MPTQAEIITERAEHGWTILSLSTLKKDGSWVLRDFKAIQKIIHREELPPYDQKEILRFLRNRAAGDKSALLRAVVAYTNPRAFGGFDWSTLNDYQRVVDRIRNDRQLSQMNPATLLDFALRRSYRPSQTEEFLLLARWPTVHDAPILETGGTRNGSSPIIVAR